MNTREVNKVDYLEFLADLLEKDLDEFDRLLIKLQRVLKRLEKIEDERTRLLLKYYERITKE